MNGLKKKTHMIILIDAEKGFDRKKTKQIHDRKYPPRNL